ncbi:MAG: AbrB family transcriptional regulator [Vibrio sp.]
MLITFFIALAGSLIFTFWSIPLGAMFGALVTLLIVGKSGLTLSLPKATLTIVQLILGMAVGAMVPVESIGNEFPILLFVGLILCMSTQVMVSYYWLHKREKWSKYESLLGSVPGAMAAVLVMNETQQSPSSKVIFTHTVRLVFLVILSGLLVSSDNPSVPGAELSLVHSWMLIPLILAYITGKLLEKAGTPASFMVTGMIAVIVTNNYFPFGNFIMPTELVFIATSALGALLGIRLKNITLIEVMSYSRAGLIATALSLTVTVLFAYVFAELIDKDFLILLMSWVPGSVESMTIAAIYIGLEPGLIMMSHIIRMVILQSIPLCFNIHGYAMHLIRRKNF